MPLYINQDVIIVNNQKENIIFLFDRKSRTKSIINEDMFEILNFIYEHEGITIKEFSNYYCDLEDVLNQLLDLGTLKQKKMWTIETFIVMDVKKFTFFVYKVY